MRDLVDREEQILVRGCTDHVGRDEEHGRHHGGIPEVIGHGNLQKDYSEDNPFCEGLVAHELCDLMGADHQNHNRE